MTNYAPIKIKLILFSGTIFCLSFIFATLRKDLPWQAVIDQLETYTANFPQEKVHLHTDKPYYALGEVIWFKAYVVVASNNKLSGMSKVLYVELINDADLVKKSGIYKIEEGLAFGSVQLTDSLKAGAYTLRAYTKYMLNYDQDFLFKKQLTIGDINEAGQVKKENIGQGRLDVQFFPEGGNLVSGLRSKMGIKASFSNGLGQQVSGHILNGAGNEVISFKTEHAGMGMIAFTPEKGETYKAVVDLRGGGIKTFDVPKALDEGQVLTVNGSEDAIMVSVNRNTVRKEQLYIIAQSGGIVYASFGLDTLKISQTIKIPQSSFPTGIVQFTLFRGNHVPVAERLYFVNNDDQLKLNIRQQTDNLLIKKKAVFELQASDARGKTVTGNFSVSVTDLEKVAYNEDDEPGILSDLLLSSDLKGNIEKPNYYFSSKSPEKKKQLDNLMLTQGWRRFVWKEILEKHYPVLNHLPEQGIEISGRASTFGGKAVPKAKIMLFSRTPGFSLMLDTLADEHGHFVFDRLSFPDTIALIVQAKTIKGRGNIDIIADEKPVVKSSKNFAYGGIEMTTYLNSTRAQFKDLENYGLRSKGIHLKTIEVKGASVKKIKNSKNLAGVSNYAYDAAFIVQSTSFLSAVRRMGGITVGADGKVYNNRTKKGNPELMYLIVDGVPIDQTQDEVLKYLNQDDVEGVELLLSPGYTIIYGMEANAGVMHVTTKRGKDVLPKSSTNLMVVKNLGFAPVREFYVPNYDKPGISKDFLDLRNTIYWNPTLKTGPDGKAIFTFYNAGQPGSYRVTVEGIDEKGNLGRQVFVCKIN